MVYRMQAIIYIMIHDAVDIIYMMHSMIYIMILDLVYHDIYDAIHDIYDDL